MTTEIAQVLLCALNDEVALWLGGITLGCQLVMHVISRLSVRLTVGLLSFGYYLDVDCLWAGRPTI